MDAGNNAAYGDKQGRDEETDAPLFIIEIHGGGKSEEERGMPRGK